MPTRQLLVAAGVLCFLSTGCAYTGSIENYLQNGFKVGPDYLKPVAEVEDNWIDAHDQRISEELPRRNDWWTVFNDPRMTHLVQMAYEQNLPLREAGLRVIEARAQRGIAIGTLLPQQQEAFGDYRRRQISTTAIESRPLIAAGVPRAFDRWSMGFDAAWELDVWGKFRRNIESADALLDASIEQYDDILVSLIAETAATYVEVRTAQEQLKYAKENIAAQQGLLEIAQSRFKAGETDELDVLQAQINLKNTQALLPTYEALERKAQIRLCILLGIPPRDLTPELATGPIPSAPATVALGIPADLLRRRPDVRKAERDVAAQSAQIGVAAADFLPQLSIKGNLSYDARKFSDLFRSSSLAGVLAPGFSWPLLNYGRIRNNVVVEDARFQQRVVHYQQTVLRANSDVERSVVSFLQAQRRVKLLAESVSANQQALKIAADQYKEGEINFQEIFTLQSFLVQEQEALAVARREVATSLIGIYKALGGGWEIRLQCDPNSDEAQDAAGELMPEEVIPVPLNEE